jgi:ABC-2 type transport system ATP-binding protein
VTALPPPPPPLGSAAEAAEARAKLAIVDSPAVPVVPEKPALPADVAATTWHADDEPTATAPLNEAAPDDEEPSAEDAVPLDEAVPVEEVVPVDEVVPVEEAVAVEASGPVDEASLAEGPETVDDGEPDAEDGVVEVADFDEWLDAVGAADSTDEPVVAKPVVDEPDLEELLAEERASEDSVSDERASEDAVFDEPVVEAVVADDFEADLPGVEAPVDADADDDDETVEATISVAEPEPFVAPDPDGFLASIDETGADGGLRLHGVTKSFGQTRAVDAIDLEIPPGSFFGLVGPNGAGKTTTLSMIAGLLRPDGGTIEIAGVDLGRDPRAAKALMGVLPDRLRTFDRLSGRQLLHYYGVLRGLRPAVAAERTADLAQAFDLTSALGRPVSDYSAGMTKKLLLAGAMIHAPRLLVLDEPFEAVDPVSSAAILDVLTRYVASGGTVILSSHGMDLVERVCDGVAVIVAGRVLARGTVDQVRGDHTLAERFVQLAGSRSDVEGLEWLHTYSD